MSNAPLSIIVVGGGIGGLSAAVALRQAGHKVKVLERTALDHEVGAAITLMHNATRILQRWGMDFKRARMTHSTGVDVVQADVTPAKMLLSIDQDPNDDTHGSPYLLCHRVDLHRALYELATNDNDPGTPAEVIPFTAVVSYDPSGGTVMLRDGSILGADLVVAADGVRSRANKYVLGEEVPAQVSEASVIRFLVPTKDILGNPKTAQLVKAADGLEKGGGRTIFYTCEDRKRWVMQNPCRDNTLQNFAAYSMHRKDHNVEEWYSQTDHTSLLNRLQGFSPAVLEVCEVAPDRLPLWRVADRDPLTLFHRGRLVLLGDACHPMLPFLGQGAAQSMEDAAVLGVLFRGLYNKHQVEERLEMFQRLRRDRVSAVQLLSRIPVSVLTVSADMTRKVEEFFPGVQVPKHRGEVLEYLYSFDCMAETERFLQER